MMKRVGIVMLGAGISLVLSGCNGSGGLFSLFGDGSENAEVVRAFSSSDSDNSGGSGGEQDLAGGSTSLEIEAATIHNPEPGSLACFGGGMAGIGWWRRRKAGKRTSS